MSQMELKATACCNCGLDVENEKRCKYGGSCCEKCWFTTYKCKCGKIVTVGDKEHAKHDNDSHLCFNCRKPGHWSRDCPEKASRANFRSRWAEEKKTYLERS